MLKPRKGLYLLRLLNCLSSVSLSVSLINLIITLSRLDVAIAGRCFLRSIVGSDDALQYRLNLALFSLKSADIKSAIVLISCSCSLCTHRMSF